MANTKFLVVDDFSTMRRIIRGLLKDIGYTDVSEAESGVEALAKLKSERFDFVITDLNMPEMTGFELVKEIRNTPTLSSLPILVVAAEAKKELIITAAQIGADGYVVKPFTAATLEEKLQKIFQKQAARG